MSEGLSIAPGLSWERSGLAHTGGINSGPGLITEGNAGAQDVVLLTEAFNPILSETGDTLLATVRSVQNGRQR